MQGGIAAPPIYQHFANRDELVQAVAADSFQRLDAVLLEAMNSVADPAATVRACCHAYCLLPLRAGASRPLPGPCSPPASHSIPPGEGTGPACGSSSAWVAPHGIVSLRTSRPHHPWPPVHTLVNAALAGQTGLDPATY